MSNPHVSPAAMLICVLAPLLLASACASRGAPAEASPQAQATLVTRQRIETADQLPRHMYSVPAPARTLLDNRARFAALARQLEADLRGDLAAYDIQIAPPSRATGAR